MNKEIKKKIKKWADKWLSEDEDYSPKKSRDLRAVSFESKHPIDGTHHHSYLFHCTEWDNGEGFIFDISSYNERTKQSEDKHYCLHSDEIDGIMSCLNHMGQFELD
jgi:hypothetical protein